MNFLLLLFHCILTLFVYVDASSDTLVLLHAVFRHGNRTPDQTSLFPRDPYLNETYDPFGYSQLTTEGKKKEYAIGQYIRTAYNDFIPQQYSPDVVYAVSTNFKRSKMSLELVLAGLFPPLESDIFAEGLNWQPISFNIDENDHIIGMPFTFCTNFVRQYYEYTLSEEGQAIMEEYRELYEFLRDNTGAKISTPLDVVGIFETLESEEDFGFTLPEWTSDIYPEELEEAAATYLEFATATPSLIRLTAGKLIEKIIDDSIAKRDGTLSEKRKIFLYSGHDFNVGILLRALNVWTNHVPPYGATIFLEIHNVEGVYGLKLYYQDYEDVNPRLLTIPGCSSFCELEKLVDLVGDHLPGAYDVCSYSGELM